MAVSTVSVEELAVALRLSVEGTDLDDGRKAVLMRLRRVATAHVELLIPNAPAAVQEECAIRFCAYIFDLPPAGRRDAYANAWVNSGAGALGSRWKIQGVAAPVAEVVVDPGPAVRLLGWSNDETVDAADLAAAGVESFEDALPIPQHDTANAYLWGATWLTDLPDHVGSSAGPLPRREDVTFDGTVWAVFRSEQLIETRLADFGLSITFSYSGRL